MTDGRQALLVAGPTFLEAFSELAAVPAPGQKPLPRRPTAAPSAASESKREEPRWHWRG